ncbi:MAG: AIR synthase family protein [Clostridiales bacterium]|nr:AIR synthase family protein [Clostridiales bacterium]
MSNIGKLTNKQLEEIVLSEIGARRDDVVMRPGIGMDCGAIKIGDDVCVLSTDPITAASKNAGTLAVHVCCNDAASAGAEPIGLLLTILAPPDASVDDIKKVVSDAQSAANKLNVEIIGGHTEFTDAVNRMVISATVIGKAENGKYFSAQGAKEDDAIIITKFAGMEGTAIIAADHRDKIEDILSQEEINGAIKLSEEISVVKEGLLARNLPVTAMHDVTEGGILGALHEMCTASNIGALINLDKVVVLNITRKICEKLDLDVYRLISSGCMLMSASDGKVVADALNENGIPACVVGMFKGKTIMAAKDGVTFEVAPPDKDEIYKI